MRIEQVVSLSALDRFLYWIGERHSIYVKRKTGLFKPWTDDKVLQSFFFTNPYRENDKTTVWFRDAVRNPLRDSSDVLFATICFRWFNVIPTGLLLATNHQDTEFSKDFSSDYLPCSLLCNWNKQKAIKLLRERAAAQQPVFTNAFMIPAPPGSKKIEHVCNCLEIIWKDRFNLRRDLRLPSRNSLRLAHIRLLEYDWLGNFMAYEVVTDLRHTYLLENATDIMTWANPGPGCIRGLYRLEGKPLSSKGNSDCLKRPDDWQYRMQKLLVAVQTRFSKLPTFEMREIEHSLCEWDKYERGLELVGARPLTGSTGKMKRRYNGL